MADKKNHERRIVIDPKAHFGKPCIAGTRIPVEGVLELIQENIPFNEIIRKYYPDLEIEDIKACVRYATDLVRSEEIHVDVAQMRLLADQDIYQITIDNLREWGHDLLTAKDIGLQQALDEDLPKRPKAENRLLLTRDKGFGGLVFLNKELSFY